MHSFHKMPIQYDDNFLNLFLRWKGSLWKLVWLDVAIFFVIYMLISCVYRFGLTYHERIMFENVILSFYPAVDSIGSTVSFVLGFFVQMTLQRWWEQFNLLPWPEELMTSIAFSLPTQDTGAHVVRRTVARYFCLTTALSGRHLSSGMMKKFPTAQELVQAGLMSDEERKMHDANPSEEVQPILPMVWMQQIIHAEGKMRNIPAPFTDRVETEICECMTKFRELFCYDWVNVPLVYTQLVAFGAYVYFIVACLGKQFMDSEERELGNAEVDYYVPIFTLLQITFYMCWFRVGIKLMKPFGEDDEDFDLNELLVRHIDVAFAMADLPMQPLPELRHVFSYKTGIVRKEQTGMMPVIIAEQIRKRAAHDTSRKQSKLAELAYPATKL